MKAVVDLLLGRAGAWLAGMLVVVAAFGTGFVKGKLDEQENQKIALADVLVKRMEVVRTVYVKDGKVAEAYERGKREREEEFNRIVEQLKGSQITVMPASCDFPDDVVRLLNIPRSAERSPSGATKPLGSMQWATSLTRR